jgi:hypothetical protein
MWCLNPRMVWGNCWLKLVMRCRVHSASVWVQMSGHLGPPKACALLLQAHLGPHPHSLYHHHFQCEICIKIWPYYSIQIASHSWNMPLIFLAQDNLGAPSFIKDLLESPKNKRLNWISELWRGMEKENRPN